MPEPEQLLDNLWLLVSLLPWHWIAAATHIMLASVAAVHAMLYKRDPRAALGWVSVCLFFPFAGALLYYMFGINRIHTEVQRLTRRHRFRFRVGYERGLTGYEPMPVAEDFNPQWRNIVHVSNSVTRRPLTGGNRFQVLKNGEQAYPAMLQAIDNAVDHVLLVSYLFEVDAIGKAFVAALIAAQQRGVKVRVIIDGVGEKYSWPRVSRRLRRAGVPVARFLPPRLMPPAFFINLRNHRKILVVDGEQGFTGGMNIGARHLVDTASNRCTADLHFQVQGPVVAQLETIFCDDWRFVTGESLAFRAVEPALRGTNWCRCISDGPNEDLDKITLVMMGAISAARRTITIITPYFLPGREMIASLQSAALRGVDVAVILPGKSNLRYIDWATRNLLGELLLHGVKVYYQPPPFAHTKLLLIDGVYAQVGSANLDPRSLRLNFELNLEVFGEDALAPLNDYCDEIRRQAAAVNLQEVDERSLVIRIRDAACWLFQPYL